MKNEPVAWMSKKDFEDYLSEDKRVTSATVFNFKLDIPLYIHPVKPAICVGHWDYKTGAFHKHLTESQQKRVDEGFLQPVYTAGMLPVKYITDEEKWEIFTNLARSPDLRADMIRFADSILKKAQENEIHD